MVSIGSTSLRSSSVRNRECPPRHAAASPDLSCRSCQPQLAGPRDNASEAFGFTIVGNFAVLRGCDLDDASGGPPCFSFRFSYDVRGPTDRETALKFIRREVAAAQERGLTARLLVPLTRPQGGADALFSRGAA